MKKFITNTIIFILPLLIIPISIWPLDKYILEKNNSQSNENVIIIGDSHTETGINDNLNAQLSNISQSSETYFFSYFKLKKIIPIKKPSKVVLGLSPHNLTFFQDEKTYALSGSEQYRELYPRYFFSLEWNAINQIVENSEGCLYSIVNSILKTNIKAILRQRNAYIGQYRKSLKSNLDTTLINDKIRTHFYDFKENIYNISKLQIEYLYKINNLCAENNINFYIVTLPVHDAYKAQIPTDFTNIYVDVVNQLKSNGVKILDYSLIDLPNKYFGDGDHINSLGADEITQKLIQDLDL